MIDDKKAERRQFSPGDQVLALLPVVSSPFQAKFHGPFTVLRQVSELNYLLSTPERRRKTQLCHVNLLKPYYIREPQSCEGEGGEQQTVKPVLVAETVGRQSAAHLPAHEDDGVVPPDDVGDAQPIRQHFYRVSEEKRKVMEKEIEYMLDNHIAEPSSSSWASPCLLVVQDFAQIIVR